MKSLADVGFNRAEASILLAASRRLRSAATHDSARRLFNLGLVKIGRVGPDWRRAVTRTRLGDWLVTGRREELTALAAETPKIVTPLGDRCVKWRDE